jgi:hypothetical protein
LCGRSGRCDKIVGLVATQFEHFSLISNRRTAEEVCNLNPLVKRSGQSMR